MQFLLPLAALFGAFILVYYYLSTCEDVLLEARDNDSRGWEIRNRLFTIFNLSFTFSLYSLLMSILGLSLGTSQLHREFDELYDGNLNYKTRVLMMVLQDSFMLVAFIIYISIMLVYYFLLDCGSWKLLVYSIAFPVVNLAIHSIEMVTAFIENSLHASSVAISYGILLMLNMIMTRALGYLYKKCLSDTHYLVGSTQTCSELEHGCHLVLANVLFLLGGVLLNAVFGSYAALYLLLPINEGFESAISQVFSAYQTLFVVIFAFFAYWFVVADKRDDRMLKATKDIQCTLKQALHQPPNTAQVPENVARHENVLPQQLNYIAESLEKIAEALEHPQDILQLLQRPLENIMQLPQQQPQNIMQVLQQQLQALQQQPHNIAQALQQALQQQEQAPLQQAEAPLASSAPTQQQEIQQALQNIAQALQQQPEKIAHTLLQIIAQGLQEQPRLVLDSQQQLQNIAQALQQPPNTVLAQLKKIAKALKNIAQALQQQPVETAHALELELRNIEKILENARISVAHAEQNLSPAHVREIQLQWMNNPAEHAGQALFNLGRTLLTIAQMFQQQPHTTGQALMQKLQTIARALDATPAREPAPQNSAQALQWQLQSIARAIKHSTN